MRTSTTIILTSQDTIVLIMTTTADDNFIPTCAGVGGGWKRIVNINITAGDDCPIGWRKDTDSSISFCCVVSDDIVVLVLLPTSPTTEQITRGCVVEQEDIRRE